MNVTYIVSNILWRHFGDIVSKSINNYTLSILTTELSIASVASLQPSLVPVTVKPDPFRNLSFLSCFVTMLVRVSR